MKWLLWLAMLCLLVPGVAWGQNAQRIPTCGTGQPPAGNSPLYMDANGNLCVGGGTSSPITTYQGTLTITGAASGVAVSTLSLNSGSGAFPTGAMGNMFFLNTGSGTAYICWFIATATSCTASGGSFPLVAGASVTKNLGASTVVPSVFSTAGTTLAITN